MRRKLFALMMGLAFLSSTFAQSRPDSGSLLQQIEQQKELIKPQATKRLRIEPLPEQIVPPKNSNNSFYPKTP